MQEELREFGLTENEVKIYIKLLELGTVNPATLAEKTGFSRPYVYDALERMLEKQMVSTVYKNNKKNYQACDPKYLLELETQKLDKIKKIIPSLQELQKKETDEIRVEHHTGKYIYKLFLKDILTTLPEGGEYLSFGIDDEYLIKNDRYYLTHLEQYYLRAHKLGIKERLIGKGKTELYNEYKITKYRFLDKEVIGNTAFAVYKNKIAIFFWGAPNHLILIESNEVADSYKKQFELLWNLAKEL